MLENPVVGINPIRARPSVRRMLERGSIQLNKLIQIVLIRHEGSPPTTLPSVSLAELPDFARRVRDAGLGGIKIFTPDPIRSDDGYGAAMDSNLSILSINCIKNVTPDLAIMPETCLCSYTKSGSCVVVNSNGKTDLDLSLERYCSLGLNQAKAGADILAPAAMVEQSILRLRQTLDEAGYYDVGLMPHVEFRSVLYAAYRAGAETGDGTHRHGFQIATDDSSSFIAASLRMKKDGASMLIVEPGLFYLDMLSLVKRKTNMPTGIFSVSGEYVMLADQGRGPSGERGAMSFALTREYFMSAIRAGADFIATYDALEFCRMHGGVK